MTQQALERLVMDRCNRELSPDAEALLSDYLALRPDAAQAAAGIEQTIALAETALQTRQVLPDALPPLSFQSLVTPHSFGPIGSWSRRFAIAAGLVLAFWLGGRLSALPSAEITAVQGGPRIGLAQAAPDAGFWSLKALTSPASKRQSVKQESIHWTSPVAWPQLGDRS